MNARWHTFRNLRLLFVMAVAVLLANASVPWLLLQRHVEEQGKVEQSLRIRETLASVLILLVDAETGERGYILTGNDDFLQPYHNARQLMPLALERLRELVKDDPARLERIDALAKDVRRKLDELQNVIDLRREQEMAAAQALVASGTVKTSMDRLRDTISTLVNEEKHRQRLQAESESAWTRQATVSFAVVTLMNGLLFVLFYRLFALRHRQRLETVISSAMDGFIAVDHRHRIILMNTAAEKIFGRKARDVIGKPLHGLLPARFRTAHAGFLDAYGKSDEPARMMGRSGTIAGLRYDGAEIPLEASISKSGRGRDMIYTVILRDITDRLQAERILRASEQRHRDLMQLAPDAIFVNHDNRITYVNDACVKLLHAGKAEQLLGRSPLIFFHPDYHALIRTRIAQMLEQPRAVPLIEEKMIAVDGTVIEVEVAATSVPADKGLSILVICRDITARKESEAALREYAHETRELLRRLSGAEEDERRKISRELHDRVGQNLATLNLGLGTLHALLPADAPAAAGIRIADMQNLLQDTSVHIRDVMADLRPPALDDFGLAAALRIHAAACSERLSLDIAVRGDDLSPRPSPAVEIAFFRIAQEAINNAAKHAQASRIDISLSSADGVVTLRIDDDGTGFDTLRTPARASWGITTMRERAQAAGAVLVIDSAPGRGTRVSVRTAQP